MMTSTITTYVRRFRFVPIHLLLVLMVIILVLLFRSGNSSYFNAKKMDKSWRQERLEQIVNQYDDAEVDLYYIRQAGFVDRRIESLTEKAIVKMNITELMVTVHSFLDNTDTMCRRQIRMGYVDEGGWNICDDDGVRPSAPPCLIYSFGGDLSESDFSFEEDISRVYGCEVHSFREDLEGEDYNRTDTIFVHPFTVGRVSEITADGKERYTFEDILTILDHTERVIDVVKIDIAGSEWPVIHSMLSNDELDGVKQLLVECHVGHPPDEDRLRREIRVFKELSEYGYRKFNVMKEPKSSFHHPYFPVAISRNYEIHYLNTRFVRPTREDRRAKAKVKN